MMKYELQRVHQIWLSTKLTVNYAEPLKYKVIMQSVTYRWDRSHLGILLDFEGCEENLL